MKISTFFICIFILSSNFIFSQKFPAGYCTAGIAQVKGGSLCDKNKYVCGGVTWSGDAKDWYANSKSKGVSVGKIAKIGAIIVFPSFTNNPYGHVGIIVKTNPLTMKSMNDLDGLGKWTTREVSGFPNKKKPIAPTGYIYYKLESI